MTSTLSGPWRLAMSIARSTATAIRSIGSIGTGVRNVVAADAGWGCGAA